MHFKNQFASLAVAVIALVMLSLWSATMEAQSSYGAITGTVTDTAGAVVPGATVTVTNTATNEAHTALTNATGLYRVTSLVPAVYTVSVEAKAFKRFVQDAATVLIDNTSRVDAQLQVGAASETVEVTSAPPMLETESGAVGSQVEGEVVQQMPLNGRNVMNLLTLVPGVIAQQSTSGAAANNANIHTYVNGWGNYSIGGGIANENAQYIDGAPNVLLGGNPPGLVLTQDMVQEFKVQSGGVSGEYGHYGGGVVNMATKSGSNAFHGSLYEYVRNTILNTNDFASNNAGLPKSPLHQNQYGVTLGGPIKRDRAFFMFSWENYSLHKASGNLSTVPTKAMRGEDPAYPDGAVFNHTLHGGPCYVNYGDAGAPGYLTAGQGFVPSSCFDSAAAVLKTFYAYPNMPVNAQGKNYSDQPLTGDDSYQYNGRVDYDLGSRNHIFGRYTKWHLQDIGQDDYNHHPGNAIAADFGATGNNTNNIVVGDTMTVNPSTVGDVRFAWMRSHFTNYGSAHNKFDLASLGGEYPALIPQLTFIEEPIFIMPGPDGLGGPWNIPVGADQIDIAETFSFNASITKIVGNHTFKFGEETFLRNHSGIGNYAWDAGESTFLNFLNGDEFASFMTGNMLNDTIHTNKGSFSINWSHGAYAIDTWHVTPKLTLNLGLRWDIPGGIYEKKDRDTVFLPQTVDANSGLPGTLALAASPLYSHRDVSPAKWSLFGPRVSFAYGLTNSLVVRGGAGLSFIPPDMPIGLMAFNSPVSAIDSTCFGTTLSHPFECPQYKGTIAQPIGRSDLTPSRDFYNKTIQSPVPTDKYPYMEEYSLTLSKEWKGSVLTEVSYAGSKGTKLPSSGVSTGTGGSFTSVDQLPTQYYSLGYTALSAMGSCNPAGLSVSVAKCLSPFPQFNAVFDTGNNTGSQNYNAIYLVFAKHFGSGGVLNANYTYSHTEGDTDQPGFGGGGSIQNFYNLRAEKAVASFDVPNRAIINYVLDLPFGKGHKWMNRGGAAGAIVGGWQVNGITTFQSGFPYSFTNNTQNSNLFVTGNSPTNSWGAGTSRPDVLPGCKLTTSGSYLSKFKNNNFFNQGCILVPGTQYTQADLNNFASVPGATTCPNGALISKECQTDVELMAFGNEPRNTDAIRGQFINNFDFAASKNTAIWEKTSLMFRAEFFNLFNHPVFGAANSELNGGTFNQGGVGNNQRLVQLSARLNF